MYVMVALYMYDLNAMAASRLLVSLESHYSLK